MFFNHGQTGEIDTKLKWYSVLTAGRGNDTGSAKPLNFRIERSLGDRYESTAAASDSSDPPAEKYEYQAEVHCLN